MKSKTHSKDIILNIDQNNYRSIGIDLEFYKKRNPKLENIIKNKNDVLSNNFNLIQAWTMKEAAFKAVSNIDSSVNFLNEISINYQNNTFLFKKLKGFIKNISDEKSYISIAYIN